MELENEVSDVLGRAKFKKSLRFELDRYIDFLKSLTQPIQIERNFKGCPDEKDNFLFDSAIKTKSQFLITGDKRLIEFDTGPVEVIC